ncbi:MAG: ribulose bisphosphate carboxylase small subunit [Micromonosporaceae bacterium]
MITYLPQPDEGQVARQIQYLLNEGFVPAIEYVREPDPRDHYRAMWKLPLFDARTVADVQAEIEACAAAHPDCFVKLIGYDRRRQTQAVSRVVHQPGPARTSQSRPGPELTADIDGFAAGIRCIGRYKRRPRQPHQRKPSASRRPALAGEWTTRAARDWPAPVISRFETGVLREPGKYLTVKRKQRIRYGEYGAETPVPTMTVAGRKYDLDPRSVQEALQDALPEPIHEHFVVINGRRWPPKQVLALVTGLDRADFTTHQARRALTRLGFSAARSASPRGRHAGASAAAAPSRSAVAETAVRPQPLVEALRPFIGLWVAVRGDEVLVAAPSPKEVVAWLAQHRQRAQSMFRVPDSEQAVTGAAPQ